MKMKEYGPGGTRPWRPLGSANVKSTGNYQGTPCIPELKLKQETLPLTKTYRIHTRSN